MQYKPLTADELNFTYKMYKTPKECCFIFNVSSILSIILACFESTSLRSCRCDANSLILPKMLSNNCNVSIQNANWNYVLNYRKHIRIGCYWLNCLKRLPFFLALYVYFCFSSNNIIYLSANFCK